jgi:hypothetical protein
MLKHFEQGEGTNVNFLSSVDDGAVGDGTRSSATTETLKQTLQPRVHS